MADNRRPHHIKTRERIRVTKLLERLQDYALGKIELDRGRVQAIKILLAKSLPDVKVVDVAVDVNHRDVSSLTNAELFSIIDGSAKRVG